MRPFVDRWVGLGLTTLLFGLGGACSGGDSTVEEQASAPQAKRGQTQATAALTCANLTPPPESGFPAGFDYPQDVSKWVSNGNGPTMRNHAWCLFAGLNTQSQPNGAFLWQTWPTSTQAFPYQYNTWPTASGGTTTRAVTLNAKNQANAEIGGVGAINNPAPVYGVNEAIVKNPRYQRCLAKIVPPAGKPVLYQLKDGAHFQSNGDIMIAGVIYNPAAFKNITGAQLANAKVLDGWLPKNPTDPPTAIAPFPSSSIVLKPMFWPVAQNGYTVLPIWDWDRNKPGSPADGGYAGYEMKNLWQRAVAISASSQPTPPSATYLYGVLDSNYQPLGPNTYLATPQISPPLLQAASINDFYHRQLNATDLAALDDCDRAILDASAYWTYNRAFQAGDYVALVAMHIMTKEQSDWTFQSAWWHPDAASCANQDRYCGNRPTNLADDTFTNYMITTTYGTEQIKGKDNYYAPPGTLPNASLWPVAYNPYIELAAAHPITTNCMNCHHRAAWPPRVELGKPDEGRSSSYLQSNPPNPNALETFPNNAAIFDGLLTLDSMWAVSDRAGYPAVVTTEDAKKKP
jgi:hypothetical protein